MNYINDFNKVVISDFDSVSLGYWLKKNYPNYSRTFFCKLLRKGAIRVNSSRVSISIRLKFNDKIKIPRILTTSKFKKYSNPISKKLIDKIDDCIIFKNENFFLINKPSGIPVQGGKNINFSVDQVLEYLRFDCTEKPKLVHRIDKDTSGLLIISRKLKYAKYLTKLFRIREIEKNYLALCMGELSYNCGIIKIPLKLKDRVYQAETLFKVLDKKENFHLIALKPITGRKHQLRNHLFHLNCPIVGDKKFNFKVRREATKELEKNLNLHSYHINFDDCDGKNLSFHADLTKEMKKNINLLNLNLSQYDQNIFSNIKDWPVIK